MNPKQRAIEIYNQHIDLAATDGRLFRKTVMNQLMVELGVTNASAATRYNQAKKACPSVDGLGRAAISKGVRRMISKGKIEDVIPDDECFTVIEVVPSTDEDTLPTVGRTHSHALQGEASEDFDEKIQQWPTSHWDMISGLGPNPGEQYKLEMGEKVIKYYLNGKLVDLTVTAEVKEEIIA